MDTEPSSSRSSLVPSSPDRRYHTQRTSPARAASVPSTTTSRRSIPRSCYNCNRKKIRCDKTDPCSACTRAGKSCTFPPQGPRIRRAKKTIMADMASRIADLEGALSKATNTARLTPEVETTRSRQKSPERPDSGSYPGPLTERAREDIIVQKGSSTHYINEILLSRVITAEQDMGSVLTPQTAALQPSAPSPFDAAGILSSPSPSISPASFQPPKPLAVRLWNTFVNFVEACSGTKLLHIPTDEVKVYTVIDNPSTAPMEDLALTFAVYFASTVSLSAQEAEIFLPRDKNMMLLEFKVGLEQSLAHGDFLDSPTITGLHALAIYTAALRVHNRGKGMWILNGLAIRMAQSLGIHRDGKRLGISPFQSEIRRRLWWHLINRDIRAGEDYGLENSSGLLLRSDVDLPVNVNDSDLEPNMKEPPQPRTCWTAMTFSLISIDMGKVMQELSAMAASSSPSSPPSEETRSKIIQDVTARAEQWLSHFNPVIPQQRLTLLCTRFMLRKFNFVTRIQWVLLQKRAGIDLDFATEQNLLEALEIIEPKLYLDDELLSQFSWTIRAYPQYHIVMYVLLHLCVRPEGPCVDRAWNAMEIFFSDEVQNGEATGFSSKLSVLAALRTKAVLIRDQAQKHGPEQRAGSSTKHPGSMPEPSSSTGINTAATLLGESGNSRMAGLDVVTEDWPDWANLVQDFQLNTSDFLWQ